MTDRRLAVVGAAILFAAVLLPPARAGSSCLGRVPTIVAGSGDNTIHGTPGDDVIVAREGNDRVFARGGDDFVCGGRGNDRIRGGTGADSLGGGLGSDVPFRSNQRRDVDGGLFGNRGDDLIRGGDGIDRLQGGKGDDTLRGGLELENGVAAAGIASANGGDQARGGTYHASWGGLIRGGGGSDNLFGGEGDDLLDSRDDIEFNDELDGGKGRRDTCRSDPDREQSC
jgi:Ca2+-binding RTX toxin-like protein